MKNKSFFKIFSLLLSLKIEFVSLVVISVLIYKKHYQYKLFNIDILLIFMFIIVFILIKNFLVIFRYLKNNE